MTGSNKLLPTALTALLLLSGCEVIGTFAMAVSGPHCGASGLPPGLEKDLIVEDERDRFDEGIALLESYVIKHNPDVLFALAWVYLQKVSAEPDDPARDRRIVYLLTYAALCGQGQAASYLGGFYRAGMLGLEKNTELGACLDRAYDPQIHEPAAIPGRVWACGLRVSDLTE